SLAANADIADAKKLLPAKPLAWVWLSLDAAHKSPQGKDLFAVPRNDATLTVLFGGILDMVGRSPYVCAALAKENDDLLLSVGMPRGRDGRREGLSLHVPPAGKSVLPPLKPKSTLFSTSYYFDIAQTWEQRKTLFNDKQVKAFEDFDKRSALFLLGNRFSQLASQVGPNHRVVVVNQPKASGYAKQPEQRLPAFALVVSLREPERFAKSLNTLLRGAGFLAGTQVKLKMEEVKHGDATIVGYRFAEDENLKGDENYLRFNYSPAFVRVGDQFVMSSTIDLAKELVDLLNK